MNKIKINKIKSEQNKQIAEELKILNKKIFNKGNIAVIKDITNSWINFTNKE